ncbi:MAG: carotenoid oxygenase family protein [Actinomycetota bacterium]
MTTWTDNARYRTVPLAPIERELTHIDLDVEGKIPEELDGLYVRNGPNQLGEISPLLHYFSGHGMLHGVRLRDGRADWYRNRAVRAGDVAQILGEPDPGGPVLHGIDFSPNTNVAVFADRLYATVEGGAAPVEITEQLETVGRSDLGGVLGDGFTGHHKIDPVHGDVHAIAYSMVLGSNALYLRLNSDGELLNRVQVPLTGATQIHDMSITEHFAVIYDLNVIFDPDMLERTTLPIAWAPDKPARVGLLPKDGTAADVRWFEVEPCYVYHPLNAYETPDGRVVIDVSRYEHAARDDAYGPLGDTLPTIDRWTFDLDGPTAVGTERRITDEPLDFPVVNPAFLGRPYRFGYTARATLDPSFEGAVKIDHGTNTTERQDFGGGNCGELTFVPRADAVDEDDGWLLGYVYQPDKERSRLVVLDAQDFAGDPVASIWIPDQHVPIGTHGDFLPGRGGSPSEMPR